jgi:hypothetical protein
MTSSAQTPKRERIARLSNASRQQSISLAPRRRRSAIATTNATPWQSPHHLPENDSSVNGEVSSGDRRGSRILMKPKPVAS